MNGFTKIKYLFHIAKFYSEWKYSADIFRREDPMKLLGQKDNYFIVAGLFFGVKFNKSISINFLNRILWEIWRSSSRDNSIIPKRVLIRIGVCDLDVELNTHICAGAYGWRSVLPYIFTWFELKSTQVRLVSI